MTLVLQTALLNAAMQRGDTMSIYPVFQAFWITFGVIGGVVFYQIGAVDLTGMSLMVIGTFFLVQHNQFVEDHEDALAGHARAGQPDKPLLHTRLQARTGDVEAQLDGALGLVDVLAARARGAQEALLDFALVDAQRVGDAHGTARLLSCARVSALRRKRAS